MGLKIRLSRAGAKKRPYYHIVGGGQPQPARRPLSWSGSAAITRCCPPSTMPSGCGCRTTASLHWLSVRARWRPTASPASSAPTGLAPMPAYPRPPAAGAGGAEEEGAGARQGCRRGRCRRLSQRWSLRRILMGVIGRPHGVRGLLHVHVLHRRSGRAHRLWAAGATSAAAGSACAGAAEGDRGEMAEIVDGSRVAVDQTAMRGRAAGQYATSASSRVTGCPRRSRTSSTWPTWSAWRRSRRMVRRSGGWRPCTTTAPAPLWKSARGWCRSPVRPCRRSTWPPAG